MNNKLTLPKLLTTHILNYEKYLRRPKWLET